jgi:hypothetical protein
MKRLSGLRLRPYFADVLSVHKDACRGREVPMRDARSLLPWLARAVAALSLVAPAAVMGAVPAGAHGTSLPDSKYYRSEVTSVAPAVPGLNISLTQGGESVILTNHTGQTVEVLGYSGEDYLRIGPSGVDENTNSLSAFLNGSLVIQGLPQQLGSQKPPAWKRVSGQPTFTWHDHRVQWMAQQRPPAVAADTSVAHKVFDWAIELKVGGKPVVVHGTLTWLGKPGPSRLAYVVLAFGALLAGALVLIVWRERSVRKANDAKAAPSPPRGETDTVSSNSLGW